MHRFLPALAALLLLAACETDANRQPTSTEPATAEDLLPIRQNGDWGFIDQNGTLLVQPQFDRAWRFSDGLALVKEGDNFGFIRPDGSYALEPRFQDAWHFTDGYAPVEMDDEWGYVDSSGSFLPDTQINLPRSALLETSADENSFELVRTGDRYGFETADGQDTIDPRFEQAWRFFDGLARAKLDGKWGFIDRSGEFVIEPQFDTAWDFDKGLAMVQVGDTLGYIDRSGEFVWPNER